jgi:tetratricopeptide (TPR) repeat protein
MAMRYPADRLRTFEEAGAAPLTAFSVLWRGGLALGALLLGFCFQAAGQTASPAAAFDARLSAERTFLAARKDSQSQPTNAVAAWVFGRACFDWAEFATNDHQRAAIAEEGIAVCRPLVKAAPRLAPAHYYLGMNLGQLARTKMLGALKLVSEMERAFKNSKSLDPHFDFAGADRCLGLLYLDAPGWPASVGDKTRARHHLLQAVEIASDHPENRLCLLEAALRWRDRKLVEREVAALRELLPKARDRLKGDAWVVAWKDWERRWNKAEAEAASMKPSGKKP